MIAQELEVSLHMAFVEARQKRHEFITVEHLLLALCDNPSASEVLKACAAEQLPTQIMILTTYGRPGYVREAIDAGARGFMIKDRPVPELADALRRVLAGEMVIDPDLAVSALGIAANPLSERERAVLRASAGGLTIRAIASELYLSASTVRNYLSQAIQKTGARTLAEAYATALNNGWI